MNIYIRRQNFLWQKVLTRAGIVLILIIGMNIFQGPLKNFFHIISSPLTNAFQEAGRNSANFFNSFVDFNGLQKENVNLKKENQNLIFKLSLLESQVGKSHALLSALESTKGDNFKLEMAQVIGLDLMNGIITLDKGLNDGILENMPVISIEKVVYGKVVKAYNNFSEVMLISSPKSVVDVKIQNTGGQAQVNGAVKGSGGNTVYLDLVDSNSEITEGDVLVTSALEGIFPRDLLVGKITSVNKNDLKAFQNAKVQPFFDIKNLDTLFVITNYKK